MANIEGKSKAYIAEFRQAFTIMHNMKATLDDIRRMPREWRKHSDGTCYCLRCVCADELQAILDEYADELLSSVGHTDE